MKRNFYSTLDLTLLRNESFYHRFFASFCLFAIEIVIGVEFHRPAARCDADQNELNHLIASPQFAEGTLLTLSVYLLSFRAFFMKNQFYWYGGTTLQLKFSFSQMPADPRLPSCGTTLITNEKTTIFFIELNTCLFLLSQLYEYY
jgi:hypothetical protein